MSVANVLSRGHIQLLLALLVAIALWWLAWLNLAKPPRQEIVAPLPDFSQYRDVRQLKSAFFAYLQPMIERQNEAIEAQRQRLLEIAERVDAGDGLSGSQQDFLEQMAQHYRIDEEVTGVQATVSVLLRRVDTIPMELALVQAAKESGWGKSRFAVDANNLFGQWCYDPGCGLVPARRGKGKVHEVELFASVEDAVADYLLNLNTHPRYKPMREIRARLRRQNNSITGMALAEGLLHYSERRQAYVDELKSMIRQYRRLARKSDPT